MRGASAAICLTLILVACGGGLTLTEYAEQVEALAAEAGTGLDTLDAQRDARGPSVEGEIVYWDSRVSVRNEFLEGFSALDPPDEVADLHELALGIFGRLTAAEDAVATRAATLDTVADIDALWASAEIKAWQAVDEEGVVICQVAQGEFDETDQRVDLQDVPWIPSEMKEIVGIAFGCTKEQRGG